MKQHKCLLCGEKSTYEYPNIRMGFCFICVEANKVCSICGVVYGNYTTGVKALFDPLGICLLCRAERSE